PLVQSVASRDWPSFRTIVLIQFVPIFPFQFLWDDDSAINLRITLQEIIKTKRCAGHDRHDRALVYDASIQRWRLKKKRKASVLGPKCIEILQRFYVGEHLNGKQKG